MDEDKDSVEILGKDRRHRRRQRRKQLLEDTEDDPAVVQQHRKQLEEIAEDTTAVQSGETEERSNDENLVPENIYRKQSRRKKKEDEGRYKEKKKKRRSRSRGLDNQSYESYEERENSSVRTENDTSQDELTERRRRRRREKKEKEVILDTHLTTSLKGLEDDLYSVSGDGDISTVSPSPLEPNFPPSQHVQKLYTEKQGRFSSTMKKKLSSVATISNHSLSQQTTSSPLHLAISAQKVFRCISIYCHGFLAGLGAWQAATVYFLHHQDLEFVELYSPISQPLHFLFYLLTVICTVSVCDRYDVSDMTLRQLKRIFLLRSGGISIFIYLAALVITLSTGNLDDKLSLYKHNETLYTSMSEDDLSSELYTWKALNLTRCILAVIGWMCLCIRPTTDLLLKHLGNLKTFSRMKDLNIQPVRMS